MSVFRSISEKQTSFGSKIPQNSFSLPETISKPSGSFQLRITFLAVEKSLLVTLALTVITSPLVIFSG